MKPDAFEPFDARMRKAGMGEAIRRAFRHSYDVLRSSASGTLAESDIDPVSDLPRLEPRTDRPDFDPALLARTVVVKLNGGLGTSMGLEGPKSLLIVKDGLTFLDIIARQVQHVRTTSRVPLKCLLMNSFSTSESTLDWLRLHPELGAPGDVELMQNKIPKVNAHDLRPVEWPANPALEWCPPGHGDLYPCLSGSGWLERLLQAGIRFMFVSNADNLGATLDPTLLARFAASDHSFLMEVCKRSAADKKGGHLARRRGQLLLRESAQCPEADQPSFQDITRHRFFNTNNLWLRLDRLRELLDQNGGMIPLPVIRNQKTVDPRDPSSPKVIQLETAMGAAIECFENAGAIVVPRSRFAPVKTTSDLLAVRSDAYAIDDEFRVSLLPERGDQPPSVTLDPKHCKRVDQLETSIEAGIPSLKACASLTTEGEVHFQETTVLRGTVVVRNPSASPRKLPPGTYEDVTVTL